MDVRAAFIEISIQLQAEFRKSTQVQHMPGRGAIREDAFAEFLRTYLPARYAVGRGELVSSKNSTSGQIDVVIYDPTHCPVLLKSSAHGVFPIESVYGVVSIKSTLSSTELADAYANVASAKKLVDRRDFEHSPTPAMVVGMGAPQIVGIVFAYQADRSLEAIQAQIVKLDAELGDDLRLRPDFVVILGEGIVGPRKQLRSEFNSYDLPKSADDLARVRRTRRHTLLRAYLQLLGELSQLVLRSLDLKKYLRMPAKIGKHLVGRSRFIRYPLDGSISDGTVTRLSPAGVAKIVAYCQAKGPVPMKQNYENTVGSIPIGLTPQQLAQPVFEYNPRNLPPLDVKKLTFDADKRPVFAEEWFQGFPFTIDGENYVVDLGALDEGDTESDPDMDAEELLSE